MANVRDSNTTLDDAADVIGGAAHTVAGKIGDTLDEAARTASRFSARLRDNGTVLQEELTDAGERFVDGAQRVGGIAADQIRAHPLAAFGIAFAIGVVATRLLRR